MSVLGARNLAALSELACLVADGTATRRSQLAQVTGLSRAAVAQRVDLLVTRGLLEETEPVATERGRPPLALQLSPEVLIGAVDLGATHCRVALTTLDGRVLAEAVREIDINDGPQRTLTGVRELTAELLGEAGRSARHLRALSIGVPGPVEHQTGTVIRPPIMQGWDGYSVPKFFQEHGLGDERGVAEDSVAEDSVAEDSVEEERGVAERGDAGMTVLVDNDVNMMAYGEFSRRRDTKHLLYIKVGTGIGCGIISNGTLHRGAAGAAGDIGHIPLPGHEDVLCHCGNTGCVEAVASGAAIAKALREAGVPAAGGRDVVRLVSEGNAVARRRVRLAGQQIGEVLASLVSFHNPEAIVIGGSIAQLHEDLLADIRGVVYRRALPLATRSLSIETSALGERAGVEGAARMAARHLLSPEGIEKLLASAR